MLLVWSASLMLISSRCDREVFSEWWVGRLHYQGNHVFRRPIENLGNHRGDSNHSSHQGSIFIFSLWFSGRGISAFWR